MSGPDFMCLRVCLECDSKMVSFIVYFLIIFVASTCYSGTGLYRLSVALPKRSLPDLGAGDELALDREDTPST